MFAQPEPLFRHDQIAGSSLQHIGNVRADNLQDHTGAHRQRELSADLAAHRSLAEMDQRVICQHNGRLHAQRLEKREHERNAYASGVTFTEREYFANKPDHARTPPCAVTLQFALRSEASHSAR